MKTTVLPLLAACALLAPKSGFAAPADLDLAFGNGGKVITDIGSSGGFGKSMAIQGDGKIIVVATGSGDFVVARYNADGSLDTAFNATGKVTTPIGSGDDEGTSVTIQSDQKIVVAGNSVIGGAWAFAVARYNANGSLDASFNGTGKVTTDIGSGDDLGSSVAIQNDGKIVVAGFSRNASGTHSDLALARYNVNGSLDTTFNGSGKIITDPGPVGGGFASGVAVQSDQKIIVAVYTYANLDFELVRYNADGALDSDFGSGGRVNTDFGGTDDPYNVVIQSDQKILLSGYTSKNNGSIYDFAVARYNPNGSLDTTFNGTGKVSTDFGGRIDYGNSTAIQSDGKILVAGASDNGNNYDFALVRYNADGTLDSGFGSGGKVTNAIGSSDDYGYGGVAIQSDGKILVAGVSRNGGTFYGALARYEGGPYPAGPEISVEQPVYSTIDDGSSRFFGNLDVGASASLTFIVKNFGLSPLTGLNVTVDGPDAAMFTVTTNPAAPVSGPTGSTTFTVRFAPTSSGTKTAQFHIASNDPDENPFDLTIVGSGIGPGVVDSAFSPEIVGNSVSATVVRPDGKMVLGGDFASVNGSARNNLAGLNADGSVESTATFNPGTGANDRVWGVALQPDGKVLLAGDFTSVNGQGRNKLARLNANGSAESTATFNAGTGADNLVYCVVLQTDRRILLAGEFTNVNGQPRNHLARLNSDGTVESPATFNAGTGADAGVQSVVVQADGKIVLGGQFTSVKGQPRIRIARLHTTGTVESTATFDAGTGADGLVYCAAVQPDGKILLGGEFASVNGAARGGIARLNADGTTESTATFDSGTGANGPVYCITLQADGKILLGGDFTSVNGEPRNRIARLNADGTIESTATFNIGIGANDFVGNLALQVDGRILLGGGFTSVDGQAHALLARLFNDPAMQVLSTPTNTRAQWMRGGSAPEVEQVTFDLSANGGASWSPLGAGTRIPGGWERTGLSLSGGGQIRARGRTIGGLFNGSSGIVEQIAVFDFLTQTPTLSAPAASTAMASPVSIAFTLPEAALPGSVALTFNDGMTFRVLTLAASQESPGAHAFSFDIANPIASPQIASGPALPEGLYAVTLSYQDALGNAAASSATATNVRITSTPIRLWKLQQLGDIDAPDLGDIDGDGLLHLVEYGLVLSPVIPNAPLAVTRFVYAEGVRLRMFLMRDPARNDVTVEVQAGPAPDGPWTTVATSALGAPFAGAGYVGGDSASAGLKTVEVRDIVNMNAAASRYIRVSVTH